MQLLGSKLINSDVFSVHAGHNIAKVRGWIVDQKDLKLCLLIVESRDKKTMYLQTSDIRSIGIINGPSVIIDYEDKLSDKEDLIRQKDLIESKFDLLGAKVYTQSGKKIGRVKDLSIDYQDFYVLKLHIKARAMQRVLNERLLIDRTDILEIKKDRIIVKDSFAKTKQSYAKVLPA